jgi:hypothetical protein
MRYYQHVARWRCRAVGFSLGFSMRVARLPPQMSEVHPLRATMSRPPTLVLYTLVGEEPEYVEDGKRQPDTNWNAFALPQRAAGGGVALADVQRAFPLGDHFHFSFRCASGAFLDLTNPRAAVPYWDGKILARVTPLGTWS